MPSEGGAPLDAEGLDLGRRQVEQPSLKRRGSRLVALGIQSRDFCFHSGHHFPAGVHRFHATGAKQFQLCDLFDLLLDQLGCVISELAQLAGLDEFQVHQPGYNLFCGHHGYTFHFQVTCVPRLV
jgi:hypothetical protein